MAGFRFEMPPLMMPQIGQMQMPQMPQLPRAQFSTNPQPQPAPAPAPQPAPAPAPQAQPQMPNFLKMLFGGGGLESLFGGGGLEGLLGGAGGGAGGFLGPLLSGLGQGGAPAAGAPKPPLQRGPMTAQNWNTVGRPMPGQTMTGGSPFSSMARNTLGG